MRADCTGPLQGGDWWMTSASAVSQVPEITVWRVGQDADLSQLTIAVIELPTHDF
jgi:hypothetical protein